MADTLLEIDNLAVAANGVHLLEGVSISLKAGELIALTGPSGCGKTTLLRAIAGLLDPVEGAVRLRGESPEELGWPAFRRRVILVAQRPVVFEGTVKDNLERVFRYASAQKAFDASRASELLDELRVEAERMEQDAVSLSEGRLTTSRSAPCHCGFVARARRTARSNSAGVRNARSGGSPLSVARRPGSSTTGTIGP